MFSSSLSDSPPTPTELTILTVSFLSLEGLYKDKYVFMYISKRFFIFTQMIPLYAMSMPLLFSLKFILEIILYQNLSLYVSHCACLNISLRLSMYTFKKKKKS